MIVFVMPKQIIYYDGKIKVEDRVDDEHQLKGHRCVWLGDQGVVFASFMPGDVEEVVKQQIDEGVWYEEVLVKGDRKRPEEANIYYASADSVYPVLLAKPTCLVPLHLLLKKAAQKKGAGENIFVGYYFGREIRYARFQDGKAVESGKREKTIEEIRSYLEGKPFSSYVVNVNVEEAEFFETVRRELRGELVKENTLLNPQVAGIFLEENKEKELFRALAATGVALFTVAGATLGLMFYKHHLRSEISSMSRKISVLNKRISESQQRRIYAYVERKSMHPERLSLPYPEPFLKQVSGRLGRYEAVFTFPDCVLSKQEERKILGRAESVTRTKNMLTVKVRLKSE